MMKLFHILFFLIVLLFSSAFTVSAQTFPKPVGYVNDFADLYSAGFENRLEQELSAFTASTSAEISVVTVNDLQETTIDDYAARLFENWKIGKQGKDNGVLLLIAKQEREMRIEVGYGLEPVITDARAGRIIRDEMTPAFKSGDYEGGTQRAVTTLEQYIRGEAVDEERSPSTPDLSWLGEIFPFLFFGLIYLGSFLARSKEYYAGGVLGCIIGIVIGIFVGGVIAILGLAFILGIIGLVIDYVLSRNYQSLKAQQKRTDWWGSRGGFYSGGRGFGGGGGFGGFGGGSSGGGGERGRW
jgi:uncharacterized protein